MSLTAAKYGRSGAPTSCRHSMADRDPCGPADGLVAESGVHPRLLQSLLGHSPCSRITDQHYVHATDEALRRVAVRLPIGASTAVPEGATSGNKWPVTA